MGYRGYFQPPCYVSRSKNSALFQISNNLSHTSLINRGEAPLSWAQAETENESDSENRYQLLKYAIETPLMKLFDELEIPDTILDKGV